MGHFYLDPSSDIGVHSDVTIYGASTMWEATTDRKRNTDTPDTSSYIEYPAQASTLTAAYNAVNIERMPKSPVSSVTSVTVNGYMVLTSGTIDASAVFYILVNGVTKYTSSSFTASGLGTGWATATWTSGDLTQTELNQLQVRVDFTSGVNASCKLYAIYLDVLTSDSSLSFTPPTDTYSNSTTSCWRPRLSPGAFWV